MSAQSTRRVRELFLKELRIEFRQRSALSGILLYLAGCVYLCYLAIHRINNGNNWKLDEMETWNALFWLLLLFIAIISTAKSFSAESRGRFLYYYTLYHPRELMTAKLLYNLSLVVTVSLLCFVFFAIFIGNPVKNLPLFLINVLLSSMAFSGVLTLTSGIAAKTNGGFTLMSVLSIPLLFPMLLLAMRTSLLATLGNSFSSCYTFLTGLAALNVIIISLGILLFPYLWRE